MVFTDFLGSVVSIGPSQSDPLLVSKSDFSAMNPGLIRYPELIPDPGGFLD
jgi:hypothetical protein